MMCEYYTAFWKRVEHLQILGIHGIPGLSLAEKLRDGHVIMGISGQGIPPDGLGRQRTSTGG